MKTLFIKNKTNPSINQSLTIPRSKYYSLLLIVLFCVTIGCSPTLPDGENFDFTGYSTSYDFRCQICHTSHHHTGLFKVFFPPCGYEDATARDYINYPDLCVKCFELHQAIILWKGEVSKLESQYNRAKFEDQERYLRKELKKARSYLNRYKTQFHRRGR